MPMPKRIVVNVNAELATALRVARLATGVPTNEFVRRAIGRALVDLLMEKGNELTGYGVDAGKLVDYCAKISPKEYVFSAPDLHAENQIKNGGVSSVGEKTLDAALKEPI